MIKRNKKEKREKRGKKTIEVEGKKEKEINRKPTEKVK